jgi:cytochrome c peroxidase
MPLAEEAAVVTLWQNDCPTRHLSMATETKEHVMFDAKIRLLNRWIGRIYSGRVAKRIHAYWRGLSVLVATAAVLQGGAALVHADGSGHDGDELTFNDPTGRISTVNLTGAFNTNGAFFKSLGTNGRACVTCHQPQDAWSISASHLRDRFQKTAGLDPVFRPVDGATCPDKDVSTVAARRDAYKLLLSKGLIRIGLAVPPNAEYEITAIADPYGCSTPASVSVYRRPLPSANLLFLSTLMWDGRESPKGRAMLDNFRSQAVDATLGHAQAVNAPSASDVGDIVDFELAVFTAQSQSDGVGHLDHQGGTGGPLALSQQDFFIGINDPLGSNPKNVPFDDHVFNLFDAWANSGDPSRASIARGEQLFNSFPIEIRGVAGINDALGVEVVHGFCTTCHDAPNAGDHSVALPIDIGVVAASRRTADMPLFTLRNKATGETVQTSDPARALITGKWADIGKTKGPILRGLAARAPYFHNGMAASLRDVVEFYDGRFLVGLTEREKNDLVAFLNAL